MVIAQLGCSFRLYKYILQHHYISKVVFSFKRFHFHPWIKHVKKHRFFLLLFLFIHGANITAQYKRKINFQYAFANTLHIVGTDGVEFAFSYLLMHANTGETYPLKSGSAHLSVLSNTNVCKSLENTWYAYLKINNSCCAYGEMICWHIITHIQRHYVYKPACKVPTWGDKRTDCKNSMKQSLFLHCQKLIINQMLNHCLLISSICQTQLFKTALWHLCFHGIRQQAKLHRGGILPDLQVHGSKQ